MPSHSILPERFVDLSEILGSPQHKLVAYEKQLLEEVEACARVRFGPSQGITRVW